MKIYCQIQTLVKAVIAAFVIGAVSGFVVAAETGGSPATPAIHGSAPAYAPARVER